MWSAVDVTAEEQNAVKSVKSEGVSVWRKAEKKVVMFRAEGLDSEAILRSNKAQSGLWIGSEYLRFERSHKVVQ